MSKNRKMVFNRRCIFLLMIGIMSLSGTHQLKAQLDTYRAYSLFVYSFGSYIQWPSNSVGDEFSIVVIGNSKITDELETMASNRKLVGKKITVKTVNSVSEINDCQMIFISDSKSGTLDEVLAKHGGKPTLVITERDGLIRKGAGISFILTDDDKLNFEINMQKLESNNLKVSQQLAKLAANTL